MKAKNMAFVLLLFTEIVASGQQCKSPCSQLGNPNARRNILQDTSVEPYSSIIQLSVKRWWNFRTINTSTASQYEKGRLITANHNLMFSPFIKSIELKFNNDTLKLRPRDFKTHHYHKWLWHKKRKDIAVLVLKDSLSNRLKGVTSFKLAKCVCVDTTDSVHLTGFPCDRLDTLVDKVDTLKLFDKKGRIVGYNHYTCKGDSGAPIWMPKNNKYHLVAIHHGCGRPPAFKKETNWGIAITEDVLKWVKSK